METTIKRLFLLYAIILLPFYAFSDTAKDLSIIRNNFHRLYCTTSDSNLMKYLIDNQPGYDVSDRVVVELQQRVPYSYDRIEAYLSKICHDGSWSDIDYYDEQRSGWIPRLHCERILELVIAFKNETSRHYNSSAVENAIHNTMNFWFEKKLTCSNWWYNQIGVPRTLGTAFILFKDNMNKTELDKAVELMKNSKFGMTGQNKVWLAANVMMRGILEDDFQLVRNAKDTIVSEIVTGGKEGIKDDWCFHQHGAQQQFGNYGLAYIYTMSLLSGVLSGTSISFTTEQLDIISSLITKGYQWIIWNGKMDINALGRQLFVSAPVHKALSVAFAISDLGCNDSIENEIINNCFTEENRFTGLNHFWQSDYTICRRNGWMASLKMASQRVLGAEMMNGDNMKGYYMGDGALYVYKTGDEYLDIFPLWDWRKLPGVTCYSDNSAMPLLKNAYYPRNDSRFVGGLSDGTNGISTFHLRRDGLKANKSWIFLDSVVLCLGAGISSDSALNVTTSVEQCWYRDNYEILDNKGRNNVNEYDNPGLLKEFNDSDNLRILHNNVGYVIWNNGNNLYCNSGNKCYAGAIKSSGSPKDIMQMQNDELIEGELFSIYIDHGMNPDSSSYCYAILPDTDEKTLEKFNISDYNVLKNDEGIQAVYIGSKSVCWASVSQASELHISSSVDIKFRTPGLYKISVSENNDYISVFCCDPTQEKESITIDVNGKEYSVILPVGNKKGTPVEIICR